MKQRGSRIIQNEFNFIDIGIPVTVKTSQETETVEPYSLQSSGLELNSPPGIA